MDIESFQGMSKKSLIKAFKNIPILIVALFLGALYLIVCMLDWVICRVQYYSKLQFNNTKNKFSKLTN
ncbi:hypothetical protein [Methanobacterium alcaliphilum]|uniref:hypothetical protein n=1 Tax=Methanobacterium alcaliphilum TaxID=392018 RepID=UPI00200A8711|nr:hypothetical protein [Methanobacterium alcaliphilum]MCK9150595.1 hypothetical protein [Methanobacterium alcaliphilum]